MTVRRAGVVAYTDSETGPAYLLLQPEAKGSDVESPLVLPEGAVKPSDRTPEAAALRHLMEETGAVGSVIAPLSTSRAPDDEVHATYFLVRAYGQGDRKDGRKREWLLYEGASKRISSDQAPLLQKAADLVRNRTLAKLAFVRAELDRLIDTFEKDSSEHKKMFRRLRRWGFVLTAIAGVLASAALAQREWQIYCNAAIVALTAWLGYLSAYEGLRTPRELWIQERTTSNALRDLRREVAYTSIAGCTESEADAYLGRLQTILNAANSKWHAHVETANARCPQATPPGPPPPNT